MSVIRTLRTIRHLQTRQIVGQLRNRLRPFVERPTPFFQQAVPERAECRWPSAPKFLAPGAQENTAADLSVGQLTFVGEEASIGWPPADWRVPALPKLWQYNLHYFEWLWALDFDDARTITLDWIERHPLDRKQVGWEPYPTSLRLMNLTAVFFGRYRQETETDEAFHQALWRSIYLQAGWLQSHLETHLLGNHLFENGAALAFTGSCFSGAVAQGWLETGLNVLRDELPEQIPGDGMHFERSPMYHSRMVYLFQLLLATDHGAIASVLDPLADRVTRALAMLCHPDGDIALLNDSAFGIYSPPKDLLPPEVEHSVGPWALPDGGYFGGRTAEGTYLICDAGDVGPDYIPGHAHGDIFSYELSLAGHRVVVDSGVYDYVPGAMRAYCRSTAAHNTVSIEDQDQCEFWGAFRVARRGKPHEVMWTPAPEGFQLTGWHDGYHRLPGKPTHHREFRWQEGQGLTVRDRISASQPVKSVTRVHLHPLCRVKLTGPREATITYAAGTFRVVFVGSGTLTVETTWYCPQFGRKEENATLAFTMEGKESEVTYSVIPD